MISATYSLSHGTFLASQSAEDFFTLHRHSDYRHPANAPEHMASFKGAVPILMRNLVAATRLSVEGPRWDHNETTDTEPQSKTRGFVVWDLVLSGREDRWGVEYAVGAYNLFDWRYRNPMSAEMRQHTLLQSGRTFLATADVRF
jgi:hypothetical protein